MYDERLLLVTDKNEDSRYSLAVPFWLDGYWYATNGFIAMRHRGDGQPDPTREVPKKPMAIFNDIESAAWQPLPPLPKGITILCRRCDGKERVKTECIYCCGSGDHECDCGDTHQCGWCKGEGISSDSCPDCTGPLNAVIVGGVRLALRYFAVLHSLGAEWSESPLECCVFFRVDGLEGAVMGVAK